MQATERSILIRNLGFGLLALVAVAATSVGGQLATYSSLAPWYAGLAKPSFTPPNWIFGPVWTTLYLLMAFSAWRILRLPSTAKRRSALILFWVQLALNAGWSWMFFGARSPLLGLLNIIPQFLAVIATAMTFYRLDRVAGSCLIPLAAWLGFAAILNLAIWSMNP
jgi:tryptophan-rich sensory protein